MAVTGRPNRQVHDRGAVTSASAGLARAGSRRRDGIMRAPVQRPRQGQSAAAAAGMQPALWAMPPARTHAGSGASNTAP